MKQEQRQGNTISRLTSAVFDNGRRGAPKPGCDCVQCFGYCLTDPDAAARESFDRSRRAAVNELGVDFGGE